jgi:hypothetical protein
VDFFFFQLAVIFLPGLIWERVVTKYALKRTPTPFETGLRTFTFGLVCYVITFAIFNLMGWGFVIPEVKKDAPFIIDRQYLSEFLTAILVSFVGSIVWLYATNHRWGGKLLVAIGATKRVGEEDIWDITFNSSAPWSEYVYVRELDKERILSGWVFGFSESEKTRELLLRNVDVYDLQGEFLYNAPLIYLARAPDSIDIEFPTFETG